ncbi:MAG TPA: alpha/beta hydrolase [Nocardioidaceae bacterium]
MAVQSRLDRVVASARRRLRYTLPGLWVALVFAVLSFTPSLLPRPALFQGLITGIDAAIGYGLGVLGAFVWREFADRPARDTSRRSWTVLGVSALVASVLAMLLGIRWQRQASDLVSIEPEHPLAMLVVPPIAALLFVTLVALGRALRTGYHRISDLLGRRMGARAARALGLVLLVSVLGTVVTGVLWDGAVNALDRAFSVADTQTPDDVTEPTTPLRSGSPESLVAFDELGREGRVFVGRGLQGEEISGLTGAPALDPIRVYAGAESAEDPEERAGLAVRDLVRAGGLERSNLLVVTTTGTGWVEPSAAGSFEVLTGGDSAIVSMQYSYLPSWLSFLVDQERAREAGRLLFDAVYEQWSALPADERPKLYVFGESLGSFGGETAFSGEFDLANRVEGALFVGPPNFNPLYRSFVDDRDPGSREVEPVYRGGRTVRFANRPRDGIEPTDRPWERSRVLYLQHPSDPITWWSPDLVLGRPDWLEEERGHDVMDETRWVPFVTFWQVTADLALGFSTEPGHGHNYTGEHVDGWAAILEPEGWTEQKADELRELVRSEALQQALDESAASGP